MLPRNLGLALLPAIFLLACQPKTGDSTTTEPDSTQMGNGYTSPNALEWQGIYKGVVPCGDCEGIQTILVLNPNNTYVRQTLYLGKGDGIPIEKTGTFSWGTDGVTMTLAGIENGPSKYRVGENQVIQLDLAGDEITGDLATRYVLAKQ